MPAVKVNGANIYYEERGSGPETIVFAHGLLWRMGGWRLVRALFGG